MREDERPKADVEAVIRLSDEGPLLAEVDGRRVLLVPPAMTGDDLSLVLSELGLDVPPSPVAKTGAEGDTDPFGHGDEVAAVEDLPVPYEPGDVVAAAEDTPVVYDPGDIIAVVDMDKLREEG